MGEDSRARQALRAYVALLGEVEDRYLGDEWSAAAFGDLADGFRSVAHLVEGSFALWFESDPERPAWRRIVSPTRKMLGDNPDALYYTAPVRDDLAYRVAGNLAGSVYLSFTVEVAEESGGYATQTSGVLNSEQFDVASDGSFEVVVGGSARDRNWLALPVGASELTTRCYFEDIRPAAADPTLVVPLTIENLAPPGPPPRLDDDAVAAGFERAARFLRSRTLDQPRPGERTPPDWVSTTPNEFPPPEKPGEMGFAAADAAYSMAPYALGDDEALVITGRWPRCVFANVALWNRYLQTYDYVHRPVSLNRASTVPEPDGSFRIVLAAEDPGIPNWIDTEGRPFGMVFWRFFLPEGEIETPKATVVKREDLR